MQQRFVPTLLVEDNEDDIVIIHEAFTDARHINIIHIARDGDEALSYLRRKEPYQDAVMPSLILLDISIPKKNGFEVLKDIKTNAMLRHIPVIMLTVSEREEDIVRAYGEGAASYICKQRNFAQFRAMIKMFETYWTSVSCLPIPEA